MTRIHVNTEDLKKSAKDFDSAAEAFARAGDDILETAMSMPSYDGQLFGPARKMGYAIQNQCREIKTALADDAESLRKTAQTFEEVDNKVVNSINNSINILATATIIETTIKAPEMPCTFTSDWGGLPDVAGWKDDGKTITIWIDGLTMVLDKSKMTEKDLEAFEDFKRAVVDVYKFLLYLAAACTLDLAAIGALIVLIIESSATAPADIIVIKPMAEFIAAMIIALGIIGSTWAVYATLIDLYLSLSDMTSAWNKLIQSGAVKSIHS
jgi:uncharacterized protein YukE